MFEQLSFANLHMGVALPVLTLVVGAVILLVLELLLPAERKEAVGWLALVGVLVSLVITIVNFGQNGEAFGGMFMQDRFTSFLNVVVLLAAGLGILLAMNYLRRSEIEHRTDYYLLLLFTTSGMMFMGAANDLITIFVALELLSIPLYVMSGMRRPDPKSEESAIKYFLLGAFASGFLVFGIAMIYGATGTTGLPGVWAGTAAIVESGSSAVYYLLLGVSLIAVSFGFKVAAVPFHMWTPDVYEGAPTPVTAFMSVGTKAASFAALLRILVVGLPTLTIAGTTAAAWVTALALIAALTVVLGNFVALRQTNLKRMLAYSSIAHAGYIMMAVAAAGHPTVADQGVQAALIYMMTYALTNMGAFAIIILIEKNDGTGIDLNNLDGLFAQRPLLALLMAFFMLSLTGIPLTAGFVGKWYVFWSAIDAELYWLAIIGALTSVVGAFYYLRIIVKMFLVEGDANISMVRIPRTVGLVLLVTGIGTFVFGVMPFLLANMSEGVQIAIDLAQLVNGG